MSSFLLSVTDMRGLSQKVQCMSASSIHILYNHAPSGGVGAPHALHTPLIIFNCTEVVSYNYGLP